MSFPWDHQLVSFIKNIPRDIDELPAILHTEDELFAPFENGTFGYGKFETGTQVRHIPPPSVETNDDCEAVRLAARRSNDPGVIELTAMATPHPSPVLSMSRQKKFSPHGASTVADSHKPVAFIEADGAKNLAKVASSASGTARTSHLRSSRTTCDLDNDLDIDDIKVQGEMAYRRFSQVQEKKKRRIDIGRSYTKRSLISVKVESVSSRSSIFSTYQKVDEEHENDFRPFVRSAYLPAEVQTGKHVNVENAVKLDRAGLSSRLGTYDCRHGSSSAGAVAARKGSKRNDTNKENGRRAKRVFVGRTRLIWSSRTRSGGLVGSGSTNSRYTYRSLLTGNRLEGGSFKRPREVSVGVRLNGNLLVTNILEETSPKSVKKVKVAGEDEVEVPPSNQVIDAAIDAACKGITISEERALVQPNFPIQVTSFPRYAPQSAMCALDCDKVLKVVREKADRGSGKGTVSAGSKTPASPNKLQEHDEKHVMIEYKPPHLDCLPLNEGTVRVVCTSPGAMEPCSVHHILNSACKKNVNSLICSVCWSSSGGSGVSVHQCIDCGLAAHLDCCSDRGERTSFPLAAISLNGSACGKTELQAPLLNSNENTKNTIASCSGEESNAWRCAVCSHFQKKDATSKEELGREKYRRPKKLPLRFQDSETLVELPQTNTVVIPEKKQQVLKCVLCPHSGGAMSPTDKKEDGDWVHEVCRIWNVGCGTQLVPCYGSGQATASERAAMTHPMLCSFTETCAICGKGGTNMEPVISNKSQSFTLGLIKCAARGCLVRFHPMCALLATKLEQETTSYPEQVSSDLESCKARDAQHCRQYNLSFVNCSRIEGSSGSMPGTAKSDLLPVGFCGLHNPKRERSFYGCPPGGFETAMRVPQIDV